MNILAPLAFVFAATIPVVILFYLLKRKRVTRLVSSTLLWKRFLAESQANAPFQRLRNNWLLILQILLLIAAILALARPYIAGKQGEGVLIVTILDGSASMLATDEVPTRFDRARSEALKLVDGLRDQDQMVVLLAGMNTQVRQSSTSSKSQLRKILAECRPAEVPTRMLEAIKLAETLVQNRANPEIHLFSDGAIPGLEQLTARNLPLTYHRVGMSDRNAGIVALEVRPNPNDTRQRALFAGIANHGSEERVEQIEFRFDGSLVETRPLRLPANSTVPLVFVFDQKKAGTFELRLSGRDNFPADDVARVYSPQTAAIRVLLVTEGNRFLEKAIRAVENVELSVASSLGATKPDADVIVLDRVRPAAWPRGNVLAIQSHPDSWFQSPRIVGDPPIVDWKPGHPLLRFCSFDNVRVAESMAVRTPSWAIPIMESTATPLIFSGETDRARVVWIGFDTLQSTWPLRLSFPIFMANAIDWLNPSTADAARLSLHTGQPLRIPLPAGITNATVILPDGKQFTLPTSSAGNELVFSDTSNQGLYKVLAGSNELAVAVNLLDADESNIRPKDALSISRYEQVAAKPLRRANLEIWRWFAALALALLMLEWWYFHRRTA
ncbi:MAG TPA: VWA domain-containing protein [Roseimicrobium sp.]|nr:VWA domain-containing protein [Roseimicrobium sp.]